MGDGDGGMDAGTASSSGDGADGDDASEDELPHYAFTQIRRLSPAEYDASVLDLLGLVTRPSAELLPLDEPDSDEDYAFDNSYEHQVVSAVLIEAAQTLAEEATSALTEDPERLASVLGCTPTGLDDEVCLRSFVVDFGRRAFRRPLSEEDIQRFMALSRCPADALDPDVCGFATQDQEFSSGVDAVIQAFLSNPRFLYRIEEGTPVPGQEGVFRLDGYEVATRLSFLLWGRGPDAWLLDKAEALELETAAQVREIASTMLKTDAARAQLGRFHAQWLGYQQLPFDATLGDRMGAETQALVERVVFDEQLPWSELFLADETFVDSVLAQHYELPAPEGTEPQWVSYGDTGRGGILSHGSFLFSGAVGTVTNPVKRGRAVVTRLLCTPIPMAPPGIAPPDPDASECKEDVLEQHAEASCAACHNQMDAIGVGLEAYDTLGRFREAEPNKPQCVITGDGTFPALGNIAETTTFRGPKELGELMLDSGLLQACAATQLVRYGLGRNIRSSNPAIHPEDLAFTRAMATQFGESGRMDLLLLDFVTSTPFLHRRVVSQEDQ